MSNVQIESVASPFSDPRVAWLAVAALTRGDAMGLLPGRVTSLDESAIQCLAKGLDQAGIGRGFSPALHHAQNADPATLARLLAMVNDALDESPAPATEWPRLSDVLGPELLGRLVGVSVSSTRRYLSQARQTPDVVAARLHFIALVVGDLAGAYNEIGVRRWFERPRKRLGGNAPNAVLVGDWRPEDEGPRRVRELATSLAFSPAT